jgi:glycosyltransferase involved in cell wall biosynthesis
VQQTVKQGADFARPHEIIVVADGDTDGSSFVAGEFTDKIVKLPAPGGPARARNLGTAVAAGSIFFLLMPM